MVRFVLNVVRFVLYVVRFVRGPFCPWSAMRHVPNSTLRSIKNQRKVWPPAPPPPPPYSEPCPAPAPPPPPPNIQNLPTPMIVSTYYSPSPAIKVTNRHPFSFILCCNGFWQLSWLDCGPRSYPVGVRISLSTEVLPTLNRIQLI